MGCCYSSSESTTNQDDLNERTHLLNNPVSDGPTTVSVNSYTTPAVPPQQKDEQSALNRILHQTANNVIDVAALDAHNMEQHDYMDRARQYSTRLTMGCSNTHRSRVITELPVGIAAPQVVLAAQPISVADIQLVTNAAQQMSRAIKEVKVKHKEDLVVPFGVP